MVEIKVLLEKGIKMPTKAHKSDAGYDIYAPESFRVAPGRSWTIDTGVHMVIPEGYVGFLKSKSGLNVKHGITGEGVVDEIIGFYTILKVIEMGGCVSFEERQKFGDMKIGCYDMPAE